MGLIDLGNFGKEIWENTEMTNVEKLEAWIKDQKENHGLVDFRVDSIYHGNLLADYAVKLGIPEEQVSHFRVDTPEDKEQAIENLAGEILDMINAPKIEDKDFFLINEITYS